METAKTNVKWFYLLLMVLSFTVTFMTRFVWSPLITTVSPIMDFSQAQAGSFMSAFFIGYVITQIPGGVWADKFGVKLTLSIGLLIGGLATIGMSFMTSYAMGFALRIITGLGAGSVMACCTRIIADYFEQSERGIAFGILLTGPTLGLMVANKLGVKILNLFGWEAAFQVIGIITIVVAVLVFFFIKKKEKNPTASGEKVTFFSGVKAVFTTRNLIGVALSGFFYMFVALGTATWINASLSNIGIESAQVANVVSLYSIGGIVGSLLTGVIVKKFNLNPKYYLIGVFVCIAIVTVAFGLQTQILMLQILGFLFGFFSYLPNAHLNALTTQFADKNLAASVMGVQNFVFQMASIISPVILGWFIDITGNFNTVWYALGLSPIVGLLFLFIIKEN